MSRSARLNLTSAIHKPCAGRPPGCALTQPGRPAAERCRRRPDRGIAGRSAAADPVDHVAVPVGALLRDALLGLVVDADDAEPLVIPVRPLEVVQQGPNEVAADVGARLSGL